MRTRRLSLLAPTAALGALTSIVACGSPPPAAPPPPPPAATAPPAPPPVAVAPPAPEVRHDRIDRLAFNRVAVHLNLPLYWSNDADNNGVIEPAEAAALLFYPGSATAAWVDASGAFTPAFEAA